MHDAALQALLDISNSMVEDISIVCSDIEDQVHARFSFEHYRYSAGFHAPLVALAETNHAEPVSDEERHVYNVIILPSCSLIAPLAASLHTELLQAGHLLEEFSTSMISRIPSTAAPVISRSILSRGSASTKIVASTSRIQEERDGAKKDYDADFASPIDLAVALESACWDLDFLVCQRASAA